MNAITRVSILTLIFCSVKAALDPSEYGKTYTKLSEEWNDICKDVTGVTQNQIKELQAGKFTNDEKKKRYILCEWRLSGILDKNLRLNEELFYADIPKTDDNVYTHESLNKCFDEAKNAGFKELYDITYQLEQCLYELSPEKYPLE